MSECPVHLHCPTTSLRHSFIFLPFELRSPPLNTVHVGSPRGEPLRLCLIALPTESVSEHTNLVQLKYKETVVQVISFYALIYYYSTVLSKYIEVETTW